MTDPQNSGPLSTRHASQEAVIATFGERIADPEVRRRLRRAIGLYQKADFPQALKLLMQLTDDLPDNAEILTISAMCLSNLGVRDLAIKLINRVFALREPGTDVLCVMYNIASQMSLHDLATKIARVLIVKEPQNPEFYHLVMTALLGQGDYGAAIDIGKSVIPLFPTHSDLWLALAIAVQWRDGTADSLQFYEEARRHNPDNVRNLTSYGAALSDKDPARAETFFRQALALAPESPEAHAGLATLLMSKGQIAEAGPHYDYRHHGGRAFGQHTLWGHRLPRWAGEDLTDKVILLDGEQGIGDEVMFSVLFSDMLARAKKVYICCEPRLVPIFRRSFPDAEIYSYVDRVEQGYLIRYAVDLQVQLNERKIHIDYACPFGTAMQFLWPTAEDVSGPEAGWLTPDENRVRQFAAELSDLGPGLKVGLCWQSMVQRSGRHQHYCGLDYFRTLADVEGVQFVNMQYGDVAGALAEFQQATGVPIHHIKDVDLRQDIDANLALAHGLDLVIGPGISTMFFAASVGTPCWWLAGEVPWWRFGRDGVIPFVPRGRYFAQGKHTLDWPSMFAELKEALIAFRGQASKPLR